MIDESPLLNPTQTTNDTEEEKALGSKSPLVTLLSLIAGPLISQVTNAFYGVFNSFLVSKGEGAEGLEVLSSLYIFDTIVYSFGILSSISAASYIPYLLAQNKKQEATKLIADLLKVVGILGIVYPSIVIPIIKKVVFWLTGKEEVIEDSFKYQCISAGGSVIMFTFQLMCGILQSLGRTWMYGFMQITALCLDMFLFLPLFIFKFKWGVWCVALSQVLSQSIPTFILICMLFCHKLNFKLTWSMYFSRISKDTWSSIKIGFASFILNLSEAFPALALQKYIMLVATHVGALDEILTTYSIVSRLYGLVVCILIAFDSAFLPAASYAFGKKLYKRVMKLFCHALWITFLWGSIASFLLIVFAKQIFSIFSKDASVISVASGLAVFCFATMPLYSIHSIVISFLQSVKKSGMATATSIITTLVPMPLISTIIYFTIGHDSLNWIFSTYLFDDFVTALISIIIAGSIIYKLYKTKDGSDFVSKKEAEEKKGMTKTESMDTIMDED